MFKIIKASAKRIGKSRNLRFLVGFGAKPQSSPSPYSTSDGESPVSFLNVAEKYVTSLYPTAAAAS